MFFSNLLLGISVSKKVQQSPEMADLDGYNHRENPQVSHTSMVILVIMVTTFNRYFKS